jgi:hypothetical protein
MEICFSFHPPHTQALLRNSSDAGRLLERYVSRGELKRDGVGLRTDPYRYWLPSSEERWQNDPIARLLQQVDDATRATQGLVSPPAFRE